MNERVTTLINKTTNANDNFKTELTFVWAPKCSLPVFVSKIVKNENTAASEFLVLQVKNTHVIICVTCGERMSVSTKIRVFF